MRKLMGKTFWNIYARSYGDLRVLSAYQQSLVDVCKAVNLPAGGRLLDVGCGAGLLLNKLRDLRPRACLTGVDRSPIMLAAARRLLGPKTRLACADVHQGFDFLEETFVVATCIQVLYSLQDPYKALKGMRKALVTGGQLVLVNPLPGGMRISPFWRRQWAEIRNGDRRLAYATIAHGPSLAFITAVNVFLGMLADEKALFTPSAEELVKAIEASGFSVTSHRVVYEGSSVLVTAKAC